MTDPRDWQWVPLRAYEMPTAEVPWQECVTEADLTKRDTIYRRKLDGFVSAHPLNHPYKPRLQVVATMRETNLLDVAATLRALAESVENGNFGKVKCGCVVLDADAIELSFFGMGAYPGAEAHLLLGMAQHKLERDTFSLRNEA